MSVESTLDSSEDLESLNSAPLVRMADVQPIDRLDDPEDILETCVIDGAEYECIVDDEESNIGSVVSVHSEEIVYDDGSMELIVPEVVEPPEYLEDPDSDLVTQDEDTKDHLSTQPKVQDSWPTLEILPGGVINKNGCNITEDSGGYMEPSEMLYACAKCSQGFKYLYCLVKHVKTHQEEEKKKDQVATLKPNQTNIICLKPKIKRKIKLKTKARKMPKKS